MSDDKTLFVTVTIEATTYWEPNYHVENDFDNDTDPAIKPQTVAVSVKGYGEVCVGREQVAINALTDAIIDAMFQADISDMVSLFEVTA